MQAKSERFELRLEQSMLDEIDAWRGRQDDVPPRAEAVRRLIEASLRSALATHFSPTAGEKLILAMLADVHAHFEIDGDIDPIFVKSAIFGGDSWALKAKYSGLATREVDPAIVEETHEILTMWRIIDAAMANLSSGQREQLKSDAGHRSIAFEGFDGNHDPHLGVMQFMVKELGLYEERGSVAINSHTQSSLPRYRALLRRFKAQTVDFNYRLTFEKLRAILCDNQKSE